MPKRENKYYYAQKDFFLDQIKKNKIKYLFFIGRRKGASGKYFFKELLDENECIVSKQFNEVLLAFDISKCKLM